MKYFIISDIFHPLFNLINYFGKISKIILVNLEYYKTRRGTCNMEGSYYLTIVDNNHSGKCLTGTLVDERGRVLESHIPKTKKKSVCTKFTR